MKPPSRVKPFRLGILRGPSQDFKPVATVGLASDGGLWVAPRAVRGFSWIYGPVTNDSPELGEHIETEHRPKLHYHRSGEVRITLTGVHLPRRSVNFEPIPDQQRGQLISIVTVRPWELETHPGGPRARDVMMIEPSWPQRVAFSLSIVEIPEGAEHAASLADDTQPFGLLPGDPSRFVVEATAYGMRALIIGRCSVDHEISGDLVPGTSVAAVPWHQRHGGEVAEALALWSSSLRNPMVWLESPDSVLTGEEIIEPRRGAIRSDTLEDKDRDMQERYWK